MTNIEEFIHRILYTATFNVTDRVMDVDKNVDLFLADLPRVFGEYHEAYRKILRPPSPSGDAA